MSMAGRFYLCMTAVMVAMALWAYANRDFVLVALNLVGASLWLGNAIHEARKS